MDVIPDYFEQRISTYRALLARLLTSQALPFDSNLRGSLPERPGIYRIFESDGDTLEALRAGRTKVAAGGLRQRVYQNHLMGDQDGNLRAQLVNDGKCVDKDAAKEYLRERCRVQYLVIENEEERKCAEHFMLAILKPKYSD